MSHSNHAVRSTMPHASSVLCANFICQHHATTHDHLQVGALAEERKIWADKVAGLERRFTSAEDENKRLRGENERLLDELRFLRSEVGHLDRKHKQAITKLVPPAPRQLGVL